MDGGAPTLRSATAALRAKNIVSSGAGGGQVGKKLTIAKKGKRSPPKGPPKGPPGGPPPGPPGGPPKGPPGGPPKGPPGGPPEETPGNKPPGDYVSPINKKPINAIKITSKTYYIDDPNAKGFKIGDHHFTVSSDSYPTTSMDEVNYLIGELIDYAEFYGNHKNKYTDEDGNEKINNRSFFQNETKDWYILPVKYNIEPKGMRRTRKLAGTHRILGRVEPMPHKLDSDEKHIIGMVVKGGSRKNHQGSRKTQKKR